MTACQCYCHVSPGATCTIDDGSSGVPGVPYCGAHASETPAEPEPKPLATPRDLWDSVDKLTRPTWKRLVRDNGHTEKVQLPSLLDQLVDAMESGAGQKTGSAFASKLPMDAGALSLLIEIAEHIRTGCWNWRIKRKHDNDKDLRQMVSAVISHGNPGEIDQTCTMVNSWCGRIKATISNDPDRTWRMHHAACRVCSSTMVPVWDEDGTESRKPALIVHSEDGRIEKIECAFCGSVLTGPDLVDLVRDTRAAVDKRAS